MSEYSDGFSLIEAVLAIFLTVAIAILAARILSNFTQSYRQRRLQGESDGGLQHCTNALTLALSRGRAGSAAIQTCDPNQCSDTCTPPSTATIPPYSRLQFEIAGSPGDYYRFCWENQTLLMMKKTGGTILGPMKLADHVSVLTFDAAFTDPAIVSYSIQIIALGANGDPSQRIVESSLTDRRVRMRTTE